jgi:hypothetical protein
MQFVDNNEEFDVSQNYAGISFTGSISCNQYVSRCALLNFMLGNACWDNAIFDVWNNTISDISDV